MRRQTALGVFTSTYVYAYVFHTQASALIKDVEKTFGLNDDEDDDTAEE